MFIKTKYELSLETTLNVHVVYYEKRLVSNVLVRFELEIFHTVNEFLRCHTA